MRVVAMALVVFVSIISSILMSCKDPPIGQPCTFNWPSEEDAEGEAQTDCSTYPSCHPLQSSSLNPTPGTEPLNDSCPVDCIQLPSLQCINLICVATQVDKGLDKHLHMNGECSVAVPYDECKEGTETRDYGCGGYCTKECLSDASCPKGYHCSPMAPFGDNLRCDDETLWGDGLTELTPEAGGYANDSEQQCTVDCQPTGTDLGDDVICPSSRDGEEIEYDYSKCKLEEYNKCCACLCYRYCPLLTKKFCRKIEWDEDMFPNATTTSDTCKPDTED